MSKIIGIIYKLKSVFPTAILDLFIILFCFLICRTAYYHGVRKLIKFAYYKKGLLEM